MLQQNKSVAIIGGGLGGLFCGALLAKEGLRVTVIEKNTGIGGGLQSFQRFGITFDAGMHIVGGMNEGGSIYRICKYLGIIDRMSLLPVDDDCIDRLHFVEDGATYSIAKGMKGFVESLAVHFPGQRENLQQYVDAMFRLTQETDLFYLRPSRSNIFMHSEDFLLPVGEFIAKYITDSHLQSVLAYMNPLYAGKADTTPAYVHSIINVLYINGACRFVGGSQLFAEELKAYIEEHGGSVLTGDPAVKVISEERTIKELVTRSGRLVSADYFVSSVHPCSLLKLLDDSQIFPKAFRTRLEEIPNSYSAFTLYVKLKEDRVPYFNHTRYCVSRYDAIWHYSRYDAQWPRGVMYLTPPEKNQGTYSRKMIITSPMQWEAVERWKDTSLGHRTEDYQQWKQQCADRMLTLLEKAMPGIRDSIEAVNTASPLTIRDYYDVRNGSMYGYIKECGNIAKSQMNVVTKVSNLFFTGQNVNLHGFCGVPLTAISTCEAILGSNYLIDRLNESY